MEKPTLDQVCQVIHCVFFNPDADAKRQAQVWLEAFQRSVCVNGLPVRAPAQPEPNDSGNLANPFASRCMHGSLRTKFCTNHRHWRRGLLPPRQ